MSAQLNGGNFDNGFVTSLASSSGKEFDISGLTPEQMAENVELNTKRFVSSMEAIKRRDWNGVF